MIRNARFQIAAGIGLLAIAALLILSANGGAVLVGFGAVICALIVIVRGAFGLSTHRDEPGERGPEKLAPPLTLLEAVRRISVVVGAAATVLGTTAFAVQLHQHEVSIAAIVIFLVGASLFFRAYIAGTPIQRTLPKNADYWDKIVTWIEEHGALVGLVALVNLVGWMYATCFLGETIGDDLTFHMAESARLADCIRAGDWDLWNPSGNAGYASAYYYQVIPQLASALPAALFGHHLFWFQLTLWLPQVGTPLAAYKGMRVMGASSWQAGFAAFAVTFVSGASRWGTGADGTFQVGLYTQTWALAAFPLGLGYGVRWLTEGKHLPAAIAWGTFVFLCHPFACIGLCIGLAVGVLASYCARPIDHRVVKIVLLALLGLALAVNIAAFFLDPMTIDKQPDLGWHPKIIYIAPMIVLAALIARVATRGVPLRAIFLGGVSLAFVANAIGFFVITVVPKRPEGATADLPAEWTLGAASLYVGPLLLLAAIAGRLALSMRSARSDPEPALAAPAPPLGGVLGAMTIQPRLLVLAAILAVTLGLFGGAALAGNVVLGMALGAIGIAAFFWIGWPTRHEPLVRLVVIGIALAVATAPGWLTVIIDRDGFGGFPHRVSDEVGPGYQELMRWYSHGSMLDNNRWVIMTWSLPIVLLFGRMQFARWLWTPALVFAALLALGPHVPKTADDLLPAVRFLGAMQVVIALGVGAGMHAIGAAVWHMRAGTLLHGAVRTIAGKRPDPELLYGVRTAVIAIAAALLIFVGLTGARQLAGRVNVLEAYDYHDEMMRMIDIVERQPQGAKQVGPGCENHWWNLLSYVYARRPALLQMGGGGLQASPNYDFLWSVRDFPKLAWVYDTPLFLFAKEKSSQAPSGEVLGETKRYELRKLPAPGPVSAVQVTKMLPEGESRAGSEVRKAAIDWLRSPEPMLDHVYAYHGYGEPGPPPDATVVRAFHVDPSPGDLADIYAEVDVKSPTTFVARQSWHPRWHAYIDGVDTPVRRVTPDFPAIDVPAGKHVLAWRFERPWWANAAWLLWPGTVLAVWIALRWLARRRGGELPSARVV